MVKIRLRRVGHKQRPFYRIVVSDSRQPLKSSAVEEVGYYNPRKVEIAINRARIEYWVRKGAQLSNAVKRLLKLAPLEAVETTDDVIAAQVEAASALNSEAFVLEGRDGVSEDVIRQHLQEANDLVEGDRQVFFDEDNDDPRRIPTNYIRAAAADNTDAFIFEEDEGISESEVQQVLLGDLTRKVTLNTNLRIQDFTEKARSEIIRDLAEVLQIRAEEIEIQGIYERSLAIVLKFKSEAAFARFVNSHLQNDASLEEFYNQWQVTGTQVHQKDQELDSERETRTSATDALDVWKEKLAFLLREEAVAHDPQQKLLIRDQIVEARARIHELESPTG